MKKRNEGQSLKEKLTTYSVALSLLLTIAGLAVGFLNFVVLNKLSPVVSRLDKVEASDKQVAANLSQHEATGTEFQKTLATKDQIESLQKMIDGRFKFLEGRVEYLYQRAIK